MTVQEKRDATFIYFFVDLKFLRNSRSKIYMQFKKIIKYIICQFIIPTVALTIVNFSVNLLMTESNYNFVEIYQ